MLKFNRLSDKQLIIVIFIIALIIRLGFGIYIFLQKGSSGFDDDWDYISYAKNIISQGIFVPDISTFYSNSYLVGPVFPLIIAFSFIIFGETYWPIIILNAVLSAFIPILIYYLGKFCFSKKTGLLAALWSVFYVQHIYRIPTVLKEVTNCFVFLLIIIIFFKVLNERKISYKDLILPIVFSILIHMDERFFTYFPIIILCFLLFNKSSLKISFKKCLVFASITIFLMLPWLIRNYYVYNRVVVLTERTTKFTDKLFGYNNYLIENEEKKLHADKVHKFTLSIFSHYMDYSEFEHKSKLDSFLTNYDLNEEYSFGQMLSINEKNDFAKTEIDSLLIEYKSKPSYIGNSKLYNIIGGLKYNIRPHKFSYWERRFIELKEYFRPFRLSAGYIGDGFRFQGIWSFKHNISLTATYGILLPFFMVGIYYILKRKNTNGIILLILVFIHMIIHVFLYHVRNRYRIPTDAFIILISFYGICNIYNNIIKPYYDNFINKYLK